MRIDKKVKMKVSPVPTMIRGIDDDLYRELKIECVRINRTIGQAINEAMMLWLENRNKRDKK